MRRTRLPRFAAFALLAVAAVRGSATAQDRPLDDSDKAAGPLGRLARALVPRQTLGGRMFWGDLVHRRGWRIQRNVFTKHHRLLDPNDVRHASGSFAECRHALSRIVAERNIPPNADHVIVVVPGLGRSSKMFDRMKARFERAGHQVAPFDYPSTVATIPDSADYLARMLDSLEETERIDLVCHSMGGILARTLAAQGHNPRIRRVVMLGTPNQGSEVARLLRHSLAFRAVMGAAGPALAPGRFVDSLPAPPGEFAVIAGCRGNGRGYNPVVDGDDDGLVTVTSTRLEGARGHVCVKGLHTWLPSNPDVMALTERFLETGRLR